MSPLPAPLRAGEEIRESWLAQLVEAIGARMRVRATPPLTAIEDESGVRIELAYEQRLELFVLSDSLSVGGSAEASVLLFNGEAWLEDETNTITVYDPLCVFEGEPGTRGWAIFHAQSGRWQIVQMACGPADCDTSSGSGGG